MISNRYFILDIETDKLPEISGLERNEVLNFILAVIIEVNFSNRKVIERYEFNTQKEMLNFFNPPKNERFTIYCHNLKFDSLFFLSELTTLPNIVYVNPLITNSKILEIKALRKDSRHRRDKNDDMRLECSLHFKDSYSLLPTSVKKLGAFLKLPKGKIDFKYDDLNEAFEYCYRDCLIVFYAIYDFMKVLNECLSQKLNIGNLPLTISSVGYSIFREMYPSAVHKYRERLEKELRPLYFGGRVEAHDFNKLEAGYVLDVNSLYPFVKCKYPFALGYIWSIGTQRKPNQVKELLEYIKSDSRILGFVAKVKEQNNETPLIPYRLTNGKIIFSNGVKRNFISLIEFKEVIEKHPEIFTIIDIERVYLSQSNTTFEGFYGKLYKLRKSYPKEHYYNYVIKILMNSAYGKDGQKPERTKRSIIAKPTRNDIKKGLIQDFNGILMKSKIVLADYQNCNLLNALLTSNYARLELYKYFQEAKIKGAKVYYCDTDSIVVSAKGKEVFNDILSSDLGALDVEMEVNNFQALDSKEYYYDNAEGNFSVKLKGVITNESNFNTPDDYKEYFLNGVLNRKLPNAITNLKRHNAPSTASIYLRHKRSFYDKRVINPDLTTNPLDLNNLNLSLIQQSNKQKLIEVLC